MHLFEKQITVCIVTVYVELSKRWLFLFWTGMKYDLSTFHFVYDTRRKKLLLQPKIANRLIVRPFTSDVSRPYSIQFIVQFPICLICYLIFRVFYRVLSISPVKNALFSIGLKHWVRNIHWARNMPLCHDCNSLEYSFRTRDTNIQVSYMAI